MRKKIVAGNWKMNTTVAEGVNLATEVVSMLAESPVNDVQVCLATPFVHLSEVKKVLEGSPLWLAAQNCSDQAKGAFTGEVSASMLKSLGVDAVIIGHSERRAYYGENNAILLAKLKQVLQNDMTPIFCIGEVLAEREADIHFDVVKKQIDHTLFELSAEEFAKVVIAYEPVWAIGTGKTASAAQAQEMHAFIRTHLATKFGKELAANCTLQYGGSCNAANAKELFANTDVDGGLIGGASLKAADFVAIVRSF